MIKRKNYGITHLCESGQGKFISDMADFGAAVRSHGFHTQPLFKVYITNITNNNNNILRAGK